MTEAQLKAKISDVENRLYESRLKDHERLNSIGWGYGMRGYRRLRDYKTTKSDKLEMQLENLNNQLHMQPADMADFQINYIKRLEEYNRCCHNQSTIIETQMEELCSEKKGEILQRLNNNSNISFVKIKDSFYFCISYERGKKEFEAI